MFSKAETSLEPGEHRSPAIDPQATAEIIEAALKKEEEEEKEEEKKEMSFFSPFRGPAQNSSMF